ncbi:MAG: type II toxin-antitoxin system RelE/ParE family toxin [Spirulina sp. SIO3F2]|nr:type II toxin-antitoxin system RelE/ParE family toxin [Spirulina sp. SIO3F2]
MSEYRLTIARSAQKSLAKLPNQIRDRILEQIDFLQTEPRPPGVRKLKGQKKSWRLRVGDYRVVYVVDDQIKQIDIVRIRHRQDVYNS